MPPSGFPHKAVAGSIIAISSVYERILARLQSGEFPDLEAAAAAVLEEIELEFRSSAGFTDEIRTGFLIFIKCCVQELQIEVREGTHLNDRAALGFEIGQISKALTNLHIDKHGNPVHR